MPVQRLLRLLHFNIGGVGVTQLMQIRGVDPIWGLVFLSTKKALLVFISSGKSLISICTQAWGMVPIKFDRFKQHK